MNIFFTLLLSSLFFAPSGTVKTLEGSLGGLYCSLHNMECKKTHADQEEPVALILSLKRGKIIHVDRVPSHLMKKYSLHHVRIRGQYFPNARTILADRMEVKIDGGYEEVWSLPSP